MMSCRELTDLLKAEGQRLGFDQIGIAPAVAPPGYPDFLRWLDRGGAAGMDYMKRNCEARGHPGRLLEDVRSVIVCSVVYGRNEPENRAVGPRQGKVARYARGADYHRVLWDRLEALLDWLRSERPEIKGRAVADTAPLLERDYARLAGLGWIGKNTMLIDRRLGSFTFLGAVLVDAELAYDTPHQANHCGTCTRCLDACPTHAFTGPYQLDAGRCISYWTIEHRGMIGDSEGAELHDWVFGCDVCQDVCPWNRKAPHGRLSELDARPEWTDPDVLEWLAREPQEWKKMLKGTALARTKRGGLLRNAALLVGTRRLPEAVAPLSSRLDDREEEAVVRAAAAWALGRIGTTEARAALGRHLDDPEPVVLEAVRRARQDPAHPSNDKGQPPGPAIPPGSP
jgi:epoxyqueuosine reductase